MIFCDLCGAENSPQKRVCDVTGQIYSPRGWKKGEKTTSTMATVLKTQLCERCFAEFSIMLGQRAQEIIDNHRQLAMDVASGQRPGRKPD